MTMMWRPLVCGLFFLLMNCRSIQSTELDSQSTFGKTSDGFQTQILQRIDEPPPPYRCDATVDRVMTPEERAEFNALVNDLNHRQFRVRRLAQVKLRQKLWEKDLLYYDVLMAADRKSQLSLEQKQFVKDAFRECVQKIDNTPFCSRVELASRKPSEMPLIEFDYAPKRTDYFGATCREGFQQLLEHSREVMGRFEQVLTSVELSTKEILDNRTLIFHRYQEPPVIPSCCLDPEQPRERRYGVRLQWNLHWESPVEMRADDGDMICSLMNDKHQELPGSFYTEHRSPSLALVFRGLEGRSASYGPSHCYMLGIPPHPWQWFWEDPRRD